MTDLNEPDDGHSSRLSRERALAGLMEAAAVLAAARFGPDGDGLFRNIDEDSHFCDDDGFKWGYRCCLALVAHEFQRMIEYGFLDDPAAAAGFYSEFVESKIGFSPIAKFDDRPR